VDSGTQGTPKIVAFSSKPWKEAIPGSICGEQREDPAQRALAVGGRWLSYDFVLRESREERFESTQTPFNSDTCRVRRNRQPLP
jgi:hypothetical protein